MAAQGGWQPRATPMGQGGVRGELGAVMEMVRRGDTQGAFQKLKRLVEERPQFPQGHAFLGNLYLRLGNVDEAARCFETALELDPRMARATLGLGQVFRQRNNIDQARVLFDRAVELDPRMSNARVQLASLLRDQGELKGAEEALNAALEVNPQDTPARLMMAAIYSDSDRNADAAKILEEMLLDKPNQESALIRLGVLRFKEKRLEDAAGLFQRACEAKPDNPMSHFLLGVIRYKLGSVDAAERKFRDTLRTNANFRPASHFLADCLIDTGRYLEAIELLRQLVARSPKKNSAHQRLAEIYVRQERFDAALREYRAAFLCDEKLALAEPKLLDIIEQTTPVEKRVKAIHQIMKRLRDDGLPEELQDQMRERQRGQLRKFQRNRMAMRSLPDAGEDVLADFDGSTPP